MRFAGRRLTRELILRACKVSTGSDSDHEAQLTFRATSCASWIVLIHADKETKPNYAFLCAVDRREFPTETLLKPFCQPNLRQR